jgi:curli biogenesis system outer membrane secretion channel CsgG
MTKNHGFIFHAALFVLLIHPFNSPSSFRQSQLLCASQNTLPSVPHDKKLVAIAGFENKSTYSADKLWETSAEMLVSELLRLPYFKLVEWAKMKHLFDREALSTSSLISDPTQRTAAQKILLCEYFISGAITRFDVRVSSKTSALSKKKTYETTIRVDLLLQDALSGEYLAPGTGEAKSVQTLKGGVTGGQTGMWDPTEANEALEVAISLAVRELICNFFGNREENP